MARVISPLLVVMLVSTLGCGRGGNVAPQNAKVKLSNARVEREFGENVFLIDYEFTEGVPVRGALYRLVMISGSQQEYTTNNYFNEEQTSGTLDAKMPFHMADDETSRTFEAHLEMLLDTGPTAPFKTISNTITITVPAS